MLRFPAQGTDRLVAVFDKSGAALLSVNGLSNETQQVR